MDGLLPRESLDTVVDRLEKIGHKGAVKVSCERKGKREQIFMPLMSAIHPTAMANFAAR